MSEQDLLRHIRERSSDLSGLFPHVLIGPGDDCAVIQTPPEGRLLLKPEGSLLLKVDQLVEGRHFRPHPATPLDLIARKAVARAVSDIAAMGGTPLCTLMSATLPTPCPWADELFDHAARWARHWACPLVGGDIASWGRPKADADSAPAPSTPGSGLVLSVTAIGTPHTIRGPVLRSTARPGDALYVTGALGGSFEPATGLGRHLTFEPRLAEARALCDGLADDLHAMIDISDGLGIDAARMAAASGIRIEIDASLVPRAPGVTDWRRAASDGEDYELLIAAAPDAVSDALRAARLTRVGRVVAGNGCVILDGGREHQAEHMGWAHT